MRKFSPVELASSSKKSRAYFRHTRWNGKRICPKCGYRLLYYLTGDRYGCKRCRYTFGEFTCTYLGKLRVPIDVVSHLLYLFVLGVPVYRIRWHVPVSLATTERVFRIFRQAIYGYLLYELQEIKLSGHIELDEALFGGRMKGGKRGWGAEGKTLVFGIYRRNGKVITFPVSDRRKETLIPLIRQHTRKGSLYYSDDHTAYATLNMIGKHQVIAHSREEYVRGEDTHINGIEGFWSYAKVWLYHYRGVPKQYFHLYLKEIEFRFNYRDENLYPILTKMLVKAASDL